MQGVASQLAQLTKLDLSSLLEAQIPTSCYCSWKVVQRLFPYIPEPAAREPRSTHTSSAGACTPGSFTRSLMNTFATVVEKMAILLQGAICQRTNRDSSKRSYVWCEEHKMEQKRTQITLWKSSVWLKFTRYKSLKTTPACLRVLWVLQWFTLSKPITCPSMLSWTVVWTWP